MANVVVDVIAVLLEIITYIDDFICKKTFGSKFVKKLI